MIQTQPEGGDSGGKQKMQKRTEDRRTAVTRWDEYRR